ncbi:MAG TPA: adenylate/guanylate cyclase domain-containing protein [Gaiellaceae bacterium]|nr:adenylate/guanylate cyclase domain-containing protein [Gaiellaceae bacterium]
MAELPTGTVTLLFTDIEGSTRLLRRVGDAYADLLGEHRRLLAGAFERHHGMIVDSEGDAFFVAFASARDAAAAAEAGQRALAEHRWPGDEELRVRMGMHTGEPRLVDGRYVGLDVHHAARVMAAGHGGQVLLSESTRVLLDDGTRLHDLGEHRLKDLSQPQRLYQLEVDGLPAEFPPLKTLDNRPTNLPVQPNELIGRERELEEAAALLTNGLRALTLTGPGGTGKTRLALQLAADVVEEFPDGVFFVSLAPVRDWELVAPTIARTIGLREQPGETVLETLDGYLGDKQLLLVLDNFEQVLAAAPAVAGLSASASRLKLLVTSRTPLHLSGERTYPVPPLELAESVRLFAERAHAAALDFDVTEENQAAVAEICRRLDGLPLAIELAATRIRSLPPPALLRRLDRRLKLLTGGAQDLDERQRTLRATIEWSYELLPQAERELFARIGVFVGGSRLDEAEAFCDAIEIDVLDGLQSLVEKSLLRQRPDADGEPRFWMLETIREFALSLLDVEGTLADARRAHAELFLSVAEGVDLESRTGDQAALFDLLEADNANLRAALDWAEEAGESELMLRLATALWGFWATRGHIAEGTRALGDAIELSGRRPARALLGLCTLRVLRGHSDGLLDDARAALRAAEELGDDYTLAQAWNLLGRVEGGLLGSMGEAEQAWWRGLEHADRGGYAGERADSIGWLLISAIFGPLPAEEGIDRAKEFLRQAGDDPTIRAWCSVERSVLEAMRGDLALARELRAEGTAALEELGLKLWAANTAQEAYLIEHVAGDPAAAIETLRASVDALEQMGEQGFLSTIAGFLAHALIAAGEDEEAERFSRASEQAAAPDDVSSQVLWRTARAKLLARRGEHESAERMVREAVEMVERTDVLNAQGDALLDLAEVMALAGRADEARAAASEAAARFERKGNVMSLARARGFTA